MSNPAPSISEASCRRLREQGFRSYSEERLAQLRFGIRFAYALCTLLVLAGVAFKSGLVLALALIVAFFGALLPNHPFDYLYNLAVRHLLDRPELPSRPIQARFACGIAAAWLAGVLYTLIYGYLVTFYVLSVLLLIVAALVSFFDKCIPSVVYNALFQPS